MEAIAKALDTPLQTVDAQVREMTKMGILQVVA